MENQRSKIASRETRIYIRRQVKNHFETTDYRESHLNTDNNPIAMKQLYKLKKKKKKHNVQFLDSNQTWHVHNENKLIDHLG